MSCFDKLAISTAPGAGYCASKSALGNPPKSCIVFGLAIVVTLVVLVSQCADIDNIACGLGSCLPSFLQLLLNSLSSMAFIGLPWPINITGMRGDGARLFPNDSNADNVDIPVMDAAARILPFLMNVLLFKIES